MQISFPFASDSIPADAVPELDAIAHMERDVAIAHMERSHGCKLHPIDCEFCQDELTGLFAEGAVP